MRISRNFPSPLNRWFRSCSIPSFALARYFLIFSPYLLGLSFFHALTVLLTSRPAFNSPRMMFLLSYCECCDVFLMGSLVFPLPQTITEV